MRIKELKIGDVCRAECTAIGRYLGEGKVLYVSAMDNGLNEDDIKIPIDTSNKYDLPLPSDESLKAHLRKIDGKCSLCGK